MSYVAASQLHRRIYQPMGNSWNPLSKNTKLYINKQPKQPASSVYMAPHMWYSMESASMCVNHM